MAARIDETIEDVQRLLILDKGYVRLVDHMGNDARVADAAHASFKKQSNDGLLSEKDSSFVGWLVEHGHISPFRHCMLTFEISAPLMVARQLWRYTVGAAQQDTLSAWNESSYRYISHDLEFYVPEPDMWRGKPANAKQGSAGLVPEHIGGYFTESLMSHIDNSLDFYKEAIDAGIAPEQARLFLPANGIYVTWYLTLSLQALSHLLFERLDAHAMAETRLYAGAMNEYAKKTFPVALAALMNTTP